MTVDLVAQRLGEGPDLVILHGLFGSGRNWSSHAKRLAERWTIHLLDLRNHGGSPWHDEVSYPAMAGDVARYLDSAGLERAVVVGHSMGGKTAMALALDQGDRLDKLVVVDIAPVPYGHSHGEFIDAMLALDLPALGRRSQVDAALVEAVPEAGVRAFLLQNLTQRDGTLSWRLNLPALQAAMPALVGFEVPLGDPYEGPTLFLAGADSPYVLPEHETRIRGLFPEAEVEHIPAAGHWVHAEQPAAFMSRLERFLDQG